MQHVLESFLLKVHHKKSFSITTKDDCGVVLLDESEAVNYTYHTLVEYFDCECRALFGYNTKRAVKMFQVKYCSFLKVDGIVGARTWDVLFG